MKKSRREGACSKRVAWGRIKPVASKAPSLETVVRGPEAFASQAQKTKLGEVDS